MKKKKQSCAANRHKCRPVFLIEQELREAMNDAASCLRNRNYARHQQAMQRIARLKRSLKTPGSTNSSTTTTAIWIEPNGLFR